VVGGIEVEVEVERQGRPRGGAQGFWRCPVCDRRGSVLFVVADAPAGSPVAFRKGFFGGVGYRSRHGLHLALIKGADIRKSLSGAAGVLSAWPKRPPHWRRDYWQRSLRDLAAAERVIAELLSATLREAKRQKARLDGQRQ